jgi:hypothetical protein
VASVIYQSLRTERDAIEAELGFRDLEWGPGQSQTRIYRYREGGIENRSAWPEAFAWLLDSATKFKDVFEPRIRQIDLSGPSAAPTLRTPGRPSRRDHAIRS